MAHVSQVWWYYLDFPSFSLGDDENLPCQSRLRVLTRLKAVPHPLERLSTEAIHFLKSVPKIGTVDSSLSCCGLNRHKCPRILITWTGPLWSFSPLALYGHCKYACLPIGAWRYRGVIRYLKPGTENPNANLHNCIEHLQVSGKIKSQWRTRARGQPCADSYLVNRS